MSQASRAAPRRRARSLPALVIVAALGAEPAAGQTTGVLLGQVYDQARRVPLEGVSVVIQETGARTATDRDGAFALEDVPEGRFTVRLALPGWVSVVEVVEITALEIALLQLELPRVDAVLEEIVVEARRSRRGESAAGTERAEAEDDVRTAADLLALRVPGLTVSRVSGVLGSGVRVRLRGLRSINAPDQPAVYLDGVRIDEGGALDMRVLDRIPAGDVLRIRVLRGPAAAFLYPLSASGVLLIETRRGGQQP